MAIDVSSPASDTPVAAPVTPALTSAEAPTLDVRKLAWSFALGLVVLMVVIGVLGWLLREPLLAAGAWFVDTFGGWGVAAGFFVGDAFTLPVLHEGFSAFGLIGGIPFWEVVAWASAGSLTGDVVGYWLSRSIAHTRWFDRIVGRKGREMRALAERYGVVLLVLGALTPITYSVCVWTVGALGMRFRTFAAVSLLRVPRVLFYTWLLEQGILHVVS